MIQVRDKDGKVVCSGKNQRSLRRYAIDHPAKTVSISEIGEGGGKLCILFRNGCSCEFNWASFAVLKEKLNNWTGLFGADLIVNGERCGKVARGNSHLI